MSQLQQFTRKLIIPVTIAMSTIVTNASALTITADGSYTIGTNATVSMSDSINTNETTATNVNISDSSGGLLEIPTLNNSANYEAYGDTTGAFATNAFGFGEYNVTSSVEYDNTIKNTSGTTQNYTFDFNIEPGFLSVFGVPTLQSDFLTSEYIFDISLNNISIFNSSAILSSTVNGVSFIESGTSIGFTNAGLSLGSSAFYQTDGFSSTLDLGPLSAGEEFNLVYGLTTRATGNISLAPRSLTNSFSSECNLELGCSGEIIEEFFFNGSSASIGDPASIGSRNIATISSSPVNVPEASSLFLLGFGLLGLVGIKRKS